MSWALRPSYRSLLMYGLSSEMYFSAGSDANASWGEGLMCESRSMLAASC